MFAYVFWHTPKPDAPASDYEQGLATFGKELLKCGCAGLRGTGSFRIPPVPWLADRAGYEDWAIVDGPGVLETLNTAAVSGAMAPLHGRVAEAMALGNGDLYQHLWGERAPFSADAAQWLTRPRGIAFRPVLVEITRSAGQPVSVWRRFMVLGPGKEFLVLGRDPLRLQLAQDWEAHSVRRSTVATASSTPQQA